MPSIRIESKNVTFNGQDTGYNHAYLLLDDNDAADSNDIQIRGGDGTDGKIAIQAGLRIEDSLDARRGASPDYRGDRIVSSADADGKWSIMNQAASEIAAAHITYTFPGSGVAVANSNSVVATLLHTIGYDIADVLPTNASMPELTGSETVLDFARDLTGTGANDTIIGWNQGDLLRGGSGDDLLSGLGGDDTLFGNLGNDHLVGGLGSDHLDGGQGNDVLEGGSGIDFLEGGAGNDYLDGGSEVDTATYLHATSAVIVNLSITAQQDTHGAGLDTLINIENLVGSNFADTLNGDANANQIQGGLGNDTINGNDGNDRLFGNQGADTIKGGLGNDYINGGQDNDTLYGNQGADELHGGLGDDYLNGGQDNDVLYGEAGTNTLVGGAGADTFVMALLGHDTITDFDETAGDKIDLSNIDAISNNWPDTLDHFTYAGNQFTNVAGQLIVIVDPTDAAGTHFLVEADRDGDGHADYTASVVSAHAIDQNAFILSHDIIAG